MELALGEINKKVSSHDLSNKKKKENNYEKYGEKI